MSEASVHPVVPFPAPVERVVRLGPFASGRDALRFTAIAAVGAVVAAWTGPLAWVPFLGAGFVLTTVRRDGRTLDDQIASRLRFHVRRRHGPRVPRLPRVIPPDRGVARLANGRRVAILAAGGIPVGFLPPREARALFEAYREILRSTAGGLYLRMGSEPLDPKRFRLPPASDGSDDAGDVLAARRGYAEMVDLVSRRRRRRVVDLVLWAASESPADLTGLGDRAEDLADRLTTLGVPTVRVRGSALTLAAARLGFEVEELE